MAVRQGRSQRGNTADECPHQSGADHDAWNAGFEAGLRLRPLRAPSRGRGNGHGAVPESTFLQGRVNAMSGTIAKRGSRSFVAKAKRLEKALSPSGASQPSRPGDTASSRRTAPAAKHQLSVTFEQSTFGGSCLPLTTRLASICCARLTPRLTNSPQAWPHTDRVGCLALTEPAK
jgi:hypothetical protein